MTRLFSMFGAAALLVSAGCGDLEVTNPNHPDLDRALQAPKDIKNVAISSVNQWYLTSTYLEPYLPMQVTADASTSNFGNFGMRFNNREPRIPYDNNSASGDRFVAQEPWYQNYSVLASANDVLRAIRIREISLGSAAETQKHEHLAQFTQAASLTNLALIFDQAFIVDETFVPGEGEVPGLVPYTEVYVAALERWEALIASSATANHSYESTTLPMPVGNLNSSRLNRIANTMAALLMAYKPRDAAEAATVNWAKVAQLAEKGIGTGSAGAPFNMEVIGDLTNWYSYINYYGNEPSWIRVDQRIAHLMDPAQPAKFDGTIVPRGTSPDARYVTDYRHHGAVIGDPGRGIYMQSPWSHSRYVHHSRFSPTRGATAVPYLLAAESDLVRAEALIRSGGSLTTAAELINITRVGRGGLPAATAAEGANQLLQYIYYERDIELLNSSGFTLFQRRIIDGLQPGTWRHLPIPARELETLNLPIYTFGGSAGEK